MTVSAFVTSRLDYCNSLYCGLPKREINKLQRVQNCAARLVSGVRRSDHITPVMKDLHRLPIGARIDFKILLLRWPEPIYMRTSCFLFAFFRINDSTDFSDFWHH